MIILQNTFPNWKLEICLSPCWNPSLFEVSFHKFFYNSRLANWSKLVVHAYYVGVRDRYRYIKILIISDTTHKGTNTVHGLGHLDKDRAIKRFVVCLTFMATSLDSLLQYKINTKKGQFWNGGIVLFIFDIQ